MFHSEGSRAPYQLMTSTRYDPFLLSLDWNNDRDGPSPFFLLPLHFDRLQQAAGVHNWLYAKSRINYREFKAACTSAVLDQQSRHNPGDSFKVRT